MLKFLDFVNDLGFELPHHLSFLTSSQEQFCYAHNDYELHQEAKQRINQYLQTATWTRASFGNLSDVDIVIAFSFGDSEEVNLELGTQVERVYQAIPHVDYYLQQEVAEHVKDVPFVSIANTEYQTTSDVAKRASNAHSGAKVVVVAQSWHAQRCIDTCKELGLDVVALRVVDSFPAEDPQPWVRNPINWIIKESYREVATGYETSERFNLM
ncbi:hypothetical protein [Vibrio sp. RE86]|uniref:hypothetical protein n=1 Tax=Vibrio sp. RE86 TaxID=2607605 RepID=UPI0020A3E4E9|nr:hypothetical protein [Vibrio sp. RE86]